MMIGHTSDRLDQAPNNVAISIIQNVGMAISSVVELAKKGEIKEQNYMIGAEDSSVIRLGRFGSMVPSEVKEKVIDVEKKLQAGQLTFEDCQVNSAESWCVKG